MRFRRYIVHLANHDWDEILFQGYGSVSVVGNRDLVVSSQGRYDIIIHDSKELVYKSAGRADLYGGEVVYIFRYKEQAEERIKRERFLWRDSKKRMEEAVSGILRGD